MISCSRVAFAYDGERLVLEDLSAHIKEGEFVCILGGNGSGKSTLAKHFNALLEPDEGTVLVNGMDTADASLVYAIRSTAGMVFQNPDDQIVASLVEDDVAFGPENLGVETPQIIERVRAALQEVGLVGFEKHETHALSGGQKQRVAIAGVLAMQPRVLILDEASSMLDPRGRKGLMRVCKELNARGMTIIMITHFMEEAAEADRVIVLNKGRVACEGTPEDVLTRAELLASLNLEVPFACSFALELQKRGLSVRETVREDDLVGEIVELAGCLGGVGGEGPVFQTVLSSHESAMRVTDKRSPARPLGRSSMGLNGPLGHLPCETARGASPLPPADNSSEPANQSNPLIEFDGVFYTYLDSARKKKNRKKAGQDKPADWGNSPHAVWALQNVSFCVQRGEFLGIAGHTGSGKSTLIQHMNGLIQPSHGRVLVEGLDLADKKNAAASRQKIGVVFQYPEHQLFAATVYDDVAFGPRNLGLDEDAMEDRVRQALQMVDLDFDDIADCSPFELSGGQQRRVAFAGVLAMQPEVLVLDEPVAGLDPAARREFLALVDRLHASGLTIVMVSHNMDDLAAHCNRILVLKEGILFALGAPQEIFLHEEALNGIGLGIPAAQRMANKLSAAGLPLPAGMLHTGETLADAVAALACKEAGRS